MAAARGPKISVIMGAYNSASTMHAALDSLFAQDFSDFEVVITDDGSKDDTPQILVEYAARFPTLKICKHPRNLGLASALNTSIAHASGEYLVRQDCDDLSAPERFKVLVAHIDADPTIDVLGTYFRVMDHNGKIWGMVRYPEVAERDQWMRGTQVAHATVIMKKASVIAVGGYDPKAIRVEDYDLWLRMIGKGMTIKTLPLPLYTVAWDIGDYKRRTAKARWQEFKFRFTRFRELGFGLRGCLFSLKPLLLILLPRTLQFKMHARAFKNV